MPPTPAVDDVVVSLSALLKVEAGLLSDKLGNLLPQEVDQQPSPPAAGDRAKAEVAAWTHILGRLLG